ncbi:MAG: gamma-glutamyl-gamma-aminobutyrate hydrolase family protein [Chloroflexi bacterium]|nr:MAG: gamma-glutamyl-gamma-aminobutyrate hydrolase family protein [Chloroflexota bacterium]
MGSFQVNRHGRAPIIGCTTYHKVVRNLEYGRSLDIIGLMPSYINAIIAAGGIPLLIPLGLDEDALLQIFSRIDGLLLPGGGDINPRLYHGSHDETIRGVDHERDRTELFLARLAVNQKKPLLAICRGHQVLNVALGGTLWEDVMARMPGAIKHDYYYTTDHPRNHVAHSVLLEGNSRIAQIVGTAEIGVNSLHHQGIRDLAPELVAVGKAPDGLIEAVEVPDHPFAIGVQWHPENLVQDDRRMLALFEALVGVAQNGHV